VDAAAGDVFRADSLGGGLSAVEKVFAAGERVSVVLPSVGGRSLIAVGQNLLTLADGAEPELWTKVRSPEGMLLNDAGVDPMGNVWIGSVDPDGQPIGELIRIGPGGRQRVMAAGFRMSNGVAFDAAGGLLHADSTAGRVLRHRLTEGSELLESSTYLEFSDREGLPDGLELDAFGGLWVALYGSGSLRHYTAAGLLDDIVEVPTPQVTNVALGGSDGLDMLITTADENPSAETPDPLAGRLFAARAATPAAPPRIARR